MFVCASSRSLPQLGLAEACHQLEDLGFSSIELWIDSRGPHADPQHVAADMEAFAAHYREQTRLVPVAFRLTEDVSAEIFQSLCKTAKLLRVSQLTVSPSPKGTPFNAEIDRLGGMVRAARGEGVRLSIKTESGTLTEDPHTAAELCQAIKGLGLSFDPSYYLRESSIEQITELMAAHAYHVYLRDSTTDQVQVPVGLGEIDYGRIISQLQRHHYDRALCVDLLPDDSPLETRCLELRKLLLLLESLL